MQPSQLSVADLGFNTITLTVSDASGNTASCHTIVQLTETIGTAEAPAMPLLRLSPNPVAGLLQWQVLGAGDFSSARLLVSDAQGRLLLSQSAVFQQAVPATLDTSALPAGVYLLSLFGDAGLVARARFCKQ